MKRVYIQPEIDIVNTHFKDGIMMEGHPDQSTGDVWDNTHTFDDEEDDEYENFFEE